MRISDWSSDVCSSDLRLVRRRLVNTALDVGPSVDSSNMAGGRHDDGIGDGRVEDPDPRVVDRAECRNRPHGLKLRRLREVGLALANGEAVAETLALVDHG